MHKATGAGGAPKSSVPKPGVKKSTGLSAPPREKTAAQLAGIAKAKESRQAKQNEKMATTGLRGLVQSTRDADLVFCQDWLKSKSHMVSFVASVMRNGTLEAEYTRDNHTPEAASDSVGIRVFSDSSTKWRGVRLAACPLLLSLLLDRPEVKSWFVGDEKLPLAVAAKAVKFLVGVDDSCDTPSGHKFAGFLNPLVALLKSVVNEIGNKLESTTEDTLDCDSD